jgi:hypothetical protein
MSGVIAALLIIWGIWRIRQWMKYPAVKLFFESGNMQRGNITIFRRKVDVRDKLREE